MMTRSTCFQSDVLLSLFSLLIFTAGVWVADGRISCTPMARNCTPAACTSVCKIAFGKPNGSCNPAEKPLCCCVDGGVQQLLQRGDTSTIANGHSVCTPFATECAVKACKSICKLEFGKLSGSCYNLVSDTVCCCSD